MKPALRWLLVALGLLAPSMALAADAAEFRPNLSGRTVLAERNFGDVRFVMGAGQAMKWLEMYAGGNFVAAFRDFEAQEVHASPDGKYFLALSNLKSSSLAFAVLDRAGRLLISGPHHDVPSGFHTVQTLRYCTPAGSASRHWVNTTAPGAQFTQDNDRFSTPAREFLSVSVTGCDGKPVLLGSYQRPEPRPPVNATRMGVLNAAGEPGSYYIGQTIANLRSLDPSFGNRTLTLIDGRRVVQPPLAVWGDTRLSTRSNCKANAASCATDLLIGRGIEASVELASALRGQLIPLQSSRSVFACEDSRADGGSPLVIDVDRTLTTALPRHPGPVRFCRQAGSGDQVLLVYEVMRGGLLHSLVRVFDGRGTLLAERETYGEQSVEFEAAGSRYSELVPAL